MSKEKKNRNEYMKEYMRKYRKEKPESNLEAVTKYWKKKLGEEFTEVKRLLEDVKENDGKESENNESV